jgi:hypothetical protein
MVRIEHDHHNFGKADGAQRIGDGKFFELFLDAGLAAQSGGVEQLDLAALPFEIHGNGIAGDAGLGSGQQPFLAQKPVDQGRLAGIGTPDNGNPQRLGLVILRSLILIVGDIGAWGCRHR